MLQTGAEVVTRDIDETSEDKQITNKEYVDEQDEALRQFLLIIELEEELEALAPATERGSWIYNPTGSAGVGQFAMFALGTPSNEFPQADNLFINSVDSAGGLHNFVDVEVGDFVEIFSPFDGDFGLYQITVVHDETQGQNSFWHFEIDHVRSNRPLADAEGNCRFKFFKLSEGADATSFVLKAGDDMTGRLSMNQTADLEDFTIPQGKTSPSIRFLTKKSDDSNSTYSPVPTWI